MSTTLPGPGTFDARAIPTFAPARSTSAVGAVAADGWRALLLFAAVYNLEFIAAPPVTSGRLALLVGVVAGGAACFAHLRRMLDELTGLVLVSVMALVYAALLTAGSGDTVQLSRNFHFAAFVILGGCVWSAVAGDPRRFVRLFAYAALAQAGFVALSLLSPGYRAWLGGTLAQGGNMELASALRPPGFSNGGGAALSVVQGLGVFAALEGAAHTRGGRRLAWTVSAGLIAASALLTGRTGLLLALVFFGVALARSARRGQRGTILSVAALLAALGAALPFVIGYLADRIPAFEQLQRWAIEIFVSGRETSSLRDLQSMPVPALTDDTLVGTGRVVGRFGNASGSDSGYVQTYFAIGLPMTIVFYATLALSLVRLAWSNPARWQRLILVGTMFLTEAKEPFIFKYAFPFFVLTLLWLERGANRGAQIPPTSRPLGQPLTESIP